MDCTYGITDDYLDDDDDGVMYSTRNYSSDSDDERPFGLEPLPHKQQRKKLKCKDSRVRDEFEKEMAAELEATVKKLTASFSSSTSCNSGNEVSKEPEYYDKVYFDSDSDSDEEGASPKQNQRKEKHRVLSNDELLYDPSMDDEDQAWVDSRRRSYQLKTRRSKKGKGIYKPEPLPQSDAVLSCPACFTTLCLDCQRHEIYKNQYRAMFVFNCVTDKSEILHFAVKEAKKKFKKSKKPNRQLEAAPSQTIPSASPDATEEVVQASVCRKDPANAVVEVEEEINDDRFHPVLCSICTTKVGVQDETEVYHFFNVLTSY